MCGIPESCLPPLLTYKLINTSQCIIFVILSDPEQVRVTQRHPLLSPLVYLAQELVENCFCRSQTDCWRSVIIEWAVWQSASVQSRTVNGSLTTPSPVSACGQPMSHFGAGAGAKCEQISWEWREGRCRSLVRCLSRPEEDRRWRAECQSDTSRQDTDSSHGERRPPAPSDWGRGGMTSLSPAGR